MSKLKLRIAVAFLKFLFAGFQLPVGVSQTVTFAVRTAAVISARPVVFGITVRLTMFLTVFDCFV
jgi:hypothetical protein